MGKTNKIFIDDTNILIGYKDYFVINTFKAEVDENNTKESNIWDFVILQDGSRSIYVAKSYEAAKHAAYNYMNDTALYDSKKFIRELDIEDPLERIMGIASSGNTDEWKVLIAEAADQLLESYDILPVITACGDSISDSLGYVPTVAIYRK